MTSCSKSKRKFCSKHFPQPFADTLATKTSTGRAQYRRVHNGDKPTIKQRNGNSEYVETDIDKRYVVPYNPWPLLKYDCHICVDIVAAKAVAYLYKYCFKGEGMAKAKILFEGNEIEAYRSIRYILRSAAMWRIFGYDMQHRSPDVILLFCHLENEQIVVNDEADDKQLRRAKANKSCSDLIKYFNRPPAPPFDDFIFLDYSEQITVQAEKRAKKRGANFAHESDSEDSGNDDDKPLPQ